MNERSEHVYGCIFIDNISLNSKYFRAKIVIKILSSFLLCYK